MGISVIIPTYNRPRLLKACLDCFQRMDFSQIGSYEIIVTDDSLENETEEFVTTYSLENLVYTRGPGRGLSANRNNGLKVARYNWVVFTDDDCEPSEGWLSAYKVAFDTFGENCLYEGRVEADRERRSFAEVAPLNPKGGSFVGCNIGFNRSVIRALGEAFSEEFKYYGQEEVDFLLRAEEKGFRLRFIETALVVHPWRPVAPLHKLILSIQSDYLLCQRHAVAKRTFSLSFRMKALLSKLVFAIPRLIKFRFRGTCAYFNEIGIEVVRIIKVSIPLLFREKRI